jgi:protein phosphatase
MSALHERFAALQSPGKRGYQEDDYGVLDADGKGEHLLFLVADGMGGHAGGDTASAVVTESFTEAYRAASGSTRERLQLALAAANAALAAAIADNSALKGMGSTLVAAVVSAAGLEWLSVGDSPLWLYRDGTL